FSFYEHIVARNYHLIINLFLNELRFEKLLTFLDILKIPRWEWIHQMYKMITTSDFMKDIFRQFEADNQNDFFDSIEELERFYRIPENFARLERGEIGDNIIHKFRV